jgi:Holliday junction DNA helicase RuvA
MIDFIEGKIAELTPAHVVVETNGVGYFISISLNTYTQLNSLEKCKMFIHEVIREDTYALYGFFTKVERTIYQLLISVSGIGPNTARMILSSMLPNEVEISILNNDVNAFKNIKGIGLKTAQRIIVDLKDKVGKSDNDDNIFILPNNTIKDESLSALVMLGFNKKNSEKLIDKLIADNPKIKVEDLIKEALKTL